MTTTAGELLPVPRAPAIAPRAAPVTVLKKFDTLTDDDLGAFRAKLAELVGDEEAGSVRWIRRAALGSDGTWHLAVTRPAVGLKEKNYHQPWNEERGYGAGLPLTRVISDDYPGMRSVVDYLPLSVEAIAFLRSNDPEGEVERRRRCWEDAWRRHDEQIEADRRARADEAERQREHRRHRPERWAALERAEKCLYLAAAMMMSGGKYSAQGPGYALLALGEQLRRPAEEIDRESPPHTFETEFIS